MGETIDQTRLEISAQRAEIEATVGEIREALDFKRRIRENPGPVIGLAAGTLFLLFGGPKRLARAARRRMAPPGDAAFDALPAALQAWVVTLAEAAGPRATEMRDALVEEVGAWRHHRVKDGKARAALARELVEGPAGPKRAGWSALEAGLVILSAALARRAVERLLTAEDTSDTKVSPASAEPTTTTPASPDATYTGFSTRGPGRSPAP